MKPAYLDISVVPGQRLAKTFIVPFDLTNVTVDFYLNNRIVKSTSDKSMAVSVNVPAVGKSKICPVFTTTETAAFASQNDYKIMATDGAGTEEMYIHGKIVLEDS